MTRIGVGIGINKSSPQALLDQQNCGIISTIDNNENNLSISFRHHVLNKQISSNSSERRHTTDGDENSNSYESPSDHDINTKINHQFSYKNSHMINLKHNSNSTTAVNLIPSKKLHYRRQCNRKQIPNVKMLAYALYRRPTHFNKSSSTTKVKLKQTRTTTTNSAQPSVILTPIPSELELATCRIYSSFQPPSESLPTMSQELFNEKLKSDHLSSFFLTNSSSNNNNQLSNNFQSLPAIISNGNPIEDTSNSNQILTNEQQDESSRKSQISSTNFQSSLITQQIVYDNDQLPGENNRLTNRNSSLDIPYIDENEFEDLGKFI